MSLSASMEDYLETILTIAEKEGSARVSDIAESLNIAASSVNEVIKKLSKLKLVEQEKYGPVILTKKGKEYAKKISCRHKIIKSFLTNVLKVNKEVAEKDACMMEHVVSSATMERLVDFLVNTDNIEMNNTCISDYIAEYKYNERLKSSSINSLNKLSVNDSGKIIRITGKGKIKKKFLEMGLIPGARIKVKGKAPLGDPITVDIKGYNLSLRQKETENIYVEVER
jgi:DtxR family Mn-dependent transcriptional regulator